MTYDTNALRNQARPAGCIWTEAEYRTLTSAAADLLSTGTEAGRKGAAYIMAALSTGHSMQSLDAIIAAAQEVAAQELNRKGF